jgi:hypothetical protein
MLGGGGPITSTMPAPSAPTPGPWLFGKIAGEAPPDPYRAPKHCWHPGAIERLVGHFGSINPKDLVAGLAGWTDIGKGPLSHFGSSGPYKVFNGLTGS